MGFQWVRITMTLNDRNARTTRPYIVFSGTLCIEVKEGTISDIEIARFCTDREFRYSTFSVSERIQDRYVVTKDH